MAIVGCPLFGSRYLRSAMNVQFHARPRFMNHPSWSHITTTIRVVTSDATTFRVTPSQVVSEHRCKRTQTQTHRHTDTQTHTKQFLQTEKQTHQMTCTHTHTCTRYTMLYCRSGCEHSGWLHHRNPADINWHRERHPGVYRIQP